MATSNSTVFVVDGDSTRRADMTALVQSLGFECQALSSARELLRAAASPSQLGCIVVGQDTKDMDALQLQERLAASGSLLRVIVVGTHFSVNEVVRAMRGGTFSVLERPYSSDELADTIRQAAAMSHDLHDSQCHLESLQAKFGTLNPRERDVMTLVVAGVPTKTIARELGVCHRTAAQIRADVFQKMDANSAVDLAIMASDLWRTDRKGIVIHASTSGQSNFASCAT